MPMAERAGGLLGLRVSQSRNDRQRVVVHSVGQKRTTCTRRRWECTRGTRSHKAPRSGAECESGTTGAGEGENSGPTVCSGKQKEQENKMQACGPI